MKTIEAIPCGTLVTLNGPAYSGVITAISIRGNLVQYEVGYFESGAYKSAWFQSFEFVQKQGKSILSIGMTGAH